MMWHGDLLQPYQSHLLPSPSTSLCPMPGQLSLLSLYLPTPPPAKLPLCVNIVVFKSSPATRSQMRSERKTPTGLKVPLRICGQSFPQSVHIAHLPSCVTVSALVKLLSQPLAISSRSVRHLAHIALQKQKVSLSSLTSRLTFLCLKPHFACSLMEGRPHSLHPATSPLLLRDADCSPVQPALAL